jgi:hypothetical protein
LVSLVETSGRVSNRDGPVRLAGSESKTRRASAATAGGAGFVPVVVEPHGDLGGDESHAATDLVERDATFGYEATDVASVMCSQVASSGMPRQVCVGS